ncbi:TonB-dependent receptor [Sphingomonas crusticola]|uniref:TonB-dependent receptor n=1 Tax=Sphingomonas crusticola TaxID=1697973 RepID=UPI000E21EB8E|nr:TonB-dependent receptor [Sphingomonas crusticola]
MKSFTLSASLARSTSALAVAACLLMPAAGLAQTGGGIDNAGATATNAQPGAAGNVAQQDAAADEIVVTGIRASLNRAIDIKRNSSGVVDAISAEDIGKFPDTNLAESLQRVTGVSINRVNGEGSEVTVRGFGGGFNLVTLNGRQLPATNLVGVGGDQNVDFATATGRSFDFGNLASEGVSTLEVYKTGRARIPTGGIGATINVVTRRPLDARDSGLSGSIGAKASYDMSMSKDVDGLKKVTPEVSGLLSWKNDADTFGISAFGSYQKRNSTAASATENAWNIRTIDQFRTENFVNASTVITNAPPTGTLVAVPNDSRYNFSESQRERINGSAVAQFRPTESLTITADVLYAQNRQNEARQDQTNWLNRPFDRVTFDSSPVATASFIQQAVPTTKDSGYEQQFRATKDILKQYGLNAKWDLTDSFTVALDGQHSTSVSKPDASNGASSTLFSMGVNTVFAQQMDWTSGFPQTNWTLNDCFDRNGTAPGGLSGNCNSQNDAGDLGTQVARTNAARQSQRINQGQVDFGWDLGQGSRFDFGGSYIDSKMRSTRVQQEQVLGDWGISTPGEVTARANDLITTFCLVCKFDKYDPGVSGPGLVAFRGNAVELFNVFSPIYQALAPTLGSNRGLRVTGNDDNSVREKIGAVYGQLTWKGQLADRETSVVIGARYERTKVKSVSLVAAPTAIIWTSDNDFTRTVSATLTPVQGTGKYNNLLPSIDFQIEPIDNVITRVSFSRTIARPGYGNLFVAQTAGAGGRATTYGGQPNGSSGNPNLQPLISDNFDVSAEWYYKPSSYISAGLFEKRVRNFVGSGITTGNLFGLRDATAATPGSRSGTARGRLTALGLDQTDVNLFSYTARLIQNGGNVAQTDADIRANSTGTAVNFSYFDQLSNQVDISPDANDPLTIFSITQPVNNREAKIWGGEFAFQHFFGNTGFGVAASYTLVRGNVSIDVLAPPVADQFALLGLSDSANASLIYDKNGLSARVTYNWRDKFLSETGRGGAADRNPVFFRPFGTLDTNISWDITPHIAVSLEAVNLLSQSVRSYGRSKNQTFFAQENKPRLLAGARYRF